MGDAVNARKREVQRGRILYPPPPPPPLLLKLPWRESALSHTNGYSIAEILLVFGIIAGVLIGVWAMYTMLAEETDVKTAVAEIQLIRDAAVQFKHNDGGGKYDGMTLATFGSYLGDGVAQQADNPPYGVLLTNTFGDTVILASDYYALESTDGGNFYLVSHGIPNMYVCKRILEHFGEVQATTFTVRDGGGGLTEMPAYYIPRGKSIFGYVGGADSSVSGCRIERSGHKASLSLRID